MSSKTVLCIGTFDAVHRGHQALVATAQGIAGTGGSVIILSFDPHPLATLRPDKTPQRLTTFEQRSEYLRNAGAVDVVRLTPSRDLLSQSPQQFVSDLVDQYHPTAFVEGPDFRFGKGRAGSIETLRELGGKHGFAVSAIEPVTCVLTDQSEVRASSSLLRWCLEHGRVRDAKLLCDRDHELWGTVIKGDQRGRDLGFPTANVQPTGDVLLPGDGIYAGTVVRPDGSTWPAAISVGTKPTFGNSPRICEAHLIGYNGPLDDYGWSIRVRFHDWLRDQIRYDSIDQLIEQLHRDCANTKAIRTDEHSRCQHA